MRPAVPAVIALVAGASGCGRIGFELEAGDDAFAITAVTPIWAMPEGGPIEVTFAEPAPDAAVTIDGAACASPEAVDALTLRCTAPPHAPAAVEVAATAADGARAVYARRFTYLTPGPYQTGGPLDDRTSGIALDADGNLYVSGATTGSLDQPNAGLEDAILLKYDATGALAWVRQLGTPAFDYARDVAVDPSGDATIVGYSAGDIDGDSQVAGNDIFVARYAPDGTRRWIVQTGTPGDDQAWDLGVDADGEVVAAVRTTGMLGAAPNAGGFDYAVVRYSAQGAVEWVRQAGTAADDIGHSITMTPDGVAYLVGYTRGVVEAGAANAGGNDLFVARYEADGTQAWIRQRGGTGDDTAHDATIDATGEVWIAGQTTGTLDGQPFAGGDDVFVMRMSAAGDWAFTRVRGTPVSETTFGVAAAPTGEVYLSCSTGGALDGQPFAGGTMDACVIAFDRAGNHAWTRLTGTTGSDAVSSCALDLGRTGLLYVSLITGGSLDGQPNRGGEDIAVFKLDASGRLR